MRIGIVGLGRLGESLARGLTRDGGEVFGFTRRLERGRQVAARVPGLTLLDSTAEVLATCDPIFVWMKPGDAAEVLAAHHDVLSARRPLLVSCHPDAPLAAHSARWADSLPNVNLATGQGVTLLAFPPGAAAEDQELLPAILAPTGAVHVVPAAELGYYSALCSCGPGLYARMMQLLADALAVRRGYDRELCRSLVRDAMAGTVALQELDQIDGDEVVRRVAHPGGSTEKGLAVIDRLFPTLVVEMLENMKRW
jgi:pyrroline-5-carboxylate reductase